MTAMGVAGLRLSRGDEEASIPHALWWPETLCLAFIDEYADSTVLFKTVKEI